MVVVADIEKTCEWAPAQWEGSTSDGCPIYVRFRWGYLSIRVGPKGGTITDAVRGGEVFGEQISDGLDGGLSGAELRKITRGRIEWPGSL